MIDWSRGYSSEWRVMEVNRDTWADGARVEGIDAVSITRDATSDLLESSTVELTATPGEDFDEAWWRIEMLATQGQERELVSIGTFLMASEGGTVDKGADSREVDGSSVLKPAAERKLPAGSFAPKGADGAEYARGLISECTPAPVETEGSFKLDAPVVFKAGTSHLEAAWAVLQAANWCMQVDGEGKVTIRQKPTDSALLLDAANASMLVPGIGHERDWSGVPNRYYAVDGTEIATAVNETEVSPTSVQARGRYIDAYDDSPIRVGGETLQAYAARRLSEESVVRTVYKYSREYWEGVLPFSVVTASMPTLGFEGELRVEKQELTCARGVLVNEEAVREDVTYPWE